MIDTVASYLARGGSITELDSDYNGTGRKQGARHEVTARRPGRQHAGKWLPTGRKTSMSRVDTRRRRGSRPRTGSRDTRPTAKQIAYQQACKGTDGWSKPRPSNLQYG